MLKLFSVLYFIIDIDAVVVSMQLSTPTLPFGGVGENGMGSYHGMFSFEAVMSRSFAGDAGLRYPPFTQEKENLLRPFLNEGITGFARARRNFFYFLKLEYN